jgi:hypothetical protein
VALMWLTGLAKLGGALTLPAGLGRTPSGTCSYSTPTDWSADACSPRCSFAFGGPDRELVTSTSAYLAVLGAPGRPVCRRDLDDHASAAGRAVARRLQPAGLLAFGVPAVAERFAATVAVAHSVRPSSLIGIFSSASMARSSPAGRPSVVR